LFKLDTSLLSDEWSIAPLRNIPFTLIPSLKDPLNWPSIQSPFGNVKIPCRIIHYRNWVKLKVGQTIPFGNVKTPCKIIHYSNWVKLKVGQTIPFGNVKTPCKIIHYRNWVKLKVGQTSPFGNVKIPCKTMQLRADTAS